jgi:hypothetical protein
MGLHFHCDIIIFIDLLFPLICRSSILKSWQTCPLVIWHKLCVTSSCNNWGNVPLVYIQQCPTTMFMLSNNLHCINSTCKVVHLIMDLVGMNCCWRGPKGQVILLNLWQLWQITHLGHLSQVAFYILRKKRFLGLPNDLLIVLLMQIIIPIVLIMSTSNCSYYWTKYYGRCTHTATAL